MNADAPTLPTEAQLQALVQLFYSRARAHPALGPVFERLIDDWPGHLRIVQDFWSHALLGTQRYRGSPYPVHTGLGLLRSHFDDWLALFREAAAETLPPAAAAQAVARAEHMARAFRAGLFPFDPV